MALRETLDRLKATALRNQHDFKPNLDVFLDPNEEQLSERHQIVERGKERGARNEPPPSTSELDPVEREITDAIRTLRDHSRGQLDIEFETHADRFAQLDFNGRATTVELEAGKAAVDFRARIAEEADRLQVRRNALIAAERELEVFRRRNALDREPRVSKMGEQILRVGLIAVLFLIEAFANTSLLAKGNELGILGAAVEAVVLSAVNIGTAWLAGVYWWRETNLNERGRRLRGRVLALSHFGFAIFLNLAIAHYRDISGTLIGDAGRKVMIRVVTDPLGLADIQSWALFAIGLIFTIVALIDAYKMGDPYPGFEACGRRRLRAEDRFKATRMDVFQLLRERHEDTVKTVEEALSALNRDFQECGRIEASRKRVIGRYRAHENSLESCGNLLLQRYREANAVARSTRSPAHFAKRWELVRSEINEEGAWAAVAKSVSALHETTLAAGKKSVALVSQAFEDAYSRLDAISVVVKGRAESIDLSGPLNPPSPDSAGSAPR